MEITEERMAADEAHILEWGDLGPHYGNPQDYIDEVRKLRAELTALRADSVLILPWCDACDCYHSTDNQDCILKRDPWRGTIPSLRDEGIALQYDEARRHAKYDLTDER